MLLQLSWPLGLPLWLQPPTLIPAFLWMRLQPALTLLLPWLPSTHSFLPLLPSLWTQCWSTQRTLSHMLDEVKWNQRPLFRNFGIAFKFRTLTKTPATMAPPVRCRPGRPQLPRRHVCGRRWTHTATSCPGLVLLVGPASWPSPWTWTTWSSAASTSWWCPQRWRAPCGCVPSCLCRVSCCLWFCHQGAPAAGDPRSGEQPGRSRCCCCVRSAQRATPSHSAGLPGSRGCLSGFGGWMYRRLGRRCSVGFQAPSPCSCHPLRWRTSCMSTSFFKNLEKSEPSIMAGQRGFPFRHVCGRHFSAN